MTMFDALDRALLDGFQTDLPLVPRPYAAIAEALGVSESQVIDRLTALHASGAVSRVGAVVAPQTVGMSTLAAMAVPPDRLREVAARVSAWPDVNHNYARDHHFNLWFVVTAADRARIDAVLAGIEAETGYTVLDLPMLEAFHIDLGFPLRWN